MRPFWHFPELGAAIAPPSFYQILPALGINGIRVNHWD
jgi:hypothetical protein